MDELDDESDEQPEVLISAIEHFSYCPRQCALIYVEQVWDENVFTIRGRHVHERVEAGETTEAHGVRTLRSIPLWSERHGIRGKADAVEFHGETAYPVEYKSGSRQGAHAALQLCAQALCLEEMLGCEVPRGALYFYATRRRQEVVLDAELRRRTLTIVAAIRAQLLAQRLPDAPNDARCRECSLLTSCMPAVVAETARLRGLQGALFVPLSSGDNEIAY